MSNRLLSVSIQSIYEKNGEKQLLPKRMAFCAHDMSTALAAIEVAVTAQGGIFRLSDLFRSYDMQLQAHLDYTSGKKASYSPAPGGSMHEAGRAFDVDLKALNMSLQSFWFICKDAGVVPIIKRPNASAKEAWHFEKRGSHQKIYDYYQLGNAKNMTPAHAMAMSAILDIEVNVEELGVFQNSAWIQSALLRLGKDIGSLDGLIGRRSKAALVELNLPIPENALEGEFVRTQLTALLQQAFPSEY